MLLLTDQDQFFMYKLIGKTFVQIQSQVNLSVNLTDISKF